MHILDTDTLAHLYAGHPRVMKHLHDVEDPDVGNTIEVAIAKGRAMTLDEAIAFVLEEY